MKLQLDLRGAIETIIHDEPEHSLSFSAELSARRHGFSCGNSSLLSISDNVFHNVAVSPVIADTGTLSHW